MGLIFFFTFGFFGKGLQELLENGINLLTNVVDNALTKASTNEVLHSLIIDGIFKGYKSVYRQDFNPIDCLKQNKKTKYYVLKRVLEKMKYYHSLGIILGDLHEENIL